MFNSGAHAPSDDGLAPMRLYGLTARDTLTPTGSNSVGLQGTEGVKSMIKDDTIGSS
jgi:hypothetical protein